MTTTLIVTFDLTYLSLTPHEYSTSSFRRPPGSLVAWLTQSDVVGRYEETEENEEEGETEEKYENEEK